MGLFLNHATRRGLSVDGGRRGFFGGGGDAGGVGGGRFLPKRESKASVGMIVQVNVEQVGTHFIHARMFYE